MKEAKYHQHAASCHKNPPTICNQHHIVFTKNLFFFFFEREEYSLNFVGRTITEDDGLQVLLDLRNARIVSIKDPTPGLWTLHFGSSGESTVRVTGLSSFDFSHGFSRRPTLHLSETDNRPIKGIYY